MTGLRGTNFHCSCVVWRRFVLHPGSYDCINTEHQRLSKETSVEWNIGEVDGASVIVFCMLSGYKRRSWGSRVYNARVGCESHSKNRSVGYQLRVICLRESGSPSGFLLMIMVNRCVPGCTLSVQLVSRVGVIAFLQSIREHVALLT
jgi:hypothetical protein